ncbi:hypothetical protein QQ045_015585 [Rhodiola kirilowii]
MWEAWIPPKVSTIIWKLCRNIVTTDDNIARVGICLPSKCMCCHKSANEDSDHLFFKSAVARRGWKFICRLFNREVPMFMLDLAVGWLWKPNKNDFMDCLQVALACCCVWEFWLYRNHMIHEGRCRNVIALLKIWAAKIGPMIKASCIPSFDHQLALDILQVTPNGLAEGGQWSCWIPGAEALTLSVSINDHRLGAIVRNQNCTFKLGVKMDMQTDDLLEVLSLALSSGSQHELSIGSIQCSHPSFR